MNISVSDLTGDIEIVGGQLVLVDGPEEYRQHLQQRLRTYFGEWFMDLSIGIPYHDGIMVKRPNDVVINNLIKREILTSPGVTVLEEYSSDYIPATRKLNVDFRAKILNESINFSEVLP
jgi:hypothetical protein